VDWLDARVDGVRLAVRLTTPRARRNAILGIAETADGNLVLKIAVTAPPEGGKANQALINLLAKQWRLTKSDIRMISGQSARAKILHIQGMPQSLAASIREAVGTAACN
jgi:hypothetical protein